MEYLPPMESGNGTILSRSNPNEIALSMFAVMTIELFGLLFCDIHFKHNKVSSVDKDLDEKI